MKTIRALLSDIIEIIDTLEMLKAPKFPAPAEYCDPGPCTPQVGTPYASAPAPADDAPVWEKARQAVAEAPQNHQVIGYTKEESAEAAACLTEAFAVAQGDPEENAHQAAMLTPEAEQTVEPVKTRKPRTPKAPKPDPVDFDAVRVEVAASISSLVEQGKKENIKELLAKFGADRAREISDENIVAFRDELILL